MSRNIIQRNFIFPPVRKAKLFTLFLCPTAVGAIKDSQKYGLTWLLICLLAPEANRFGWVTPGRGITGEQPPF